MIIGGLQKVSLIDYPGKVCSVIFTRGCNMRCIYCHNSHLVLPENYSQEIAEENVLQFLKSRIGKINYVTVTGGEPTIHNDLPLFLEKIKAIGYKIKLDTNGTNPEILELLINNQLLDFVALDVKSTPEKYNLISGVVTNLNRIKDSIRIINASRINKQFRITILKPFITINELKEVKNLAGSSLILQNFKYVDSIIDKSLSHSNEFNISEFKNIRTSLEPSPNVKE